MPSQLGSAHHLRVRDRLAQIPTTVRAQYTLKLHKETPSTKERTVEPWVTESKRPKVSIDAGLHDGEDICATYTGLFIAVKPDHPV